MRLQALIRRLSMLLQGCLYLLVPPVCRYTEWETGFEVLLTNVMAPMEDAGSGDDKGRKAFLSSILGIRVKSKLSRGGSTSGSLPLGADISESAFGSALASRLLHRRTLFSGESGGAGGFGLQHLVFV